MDELLMATDASRILNRSVGAVHLYEKAGKLPALKTASGVRLFRRADVEELAQKLRAKSQAKAGVRPDVS